MPDETSPVTLDFLVSLFHDAKGSVEFRLISADRATQHFFEIADLFDRWPAIEKSLQGANEKGANIYLGVNARVDLWTVHWTDTEKKRHYRGFDRKEEAESFLNATDAVSKFLSPAPEPQGSLEYIKECRVLWLDVDYRGELLKKNGTVLNALKLQPSIVVDSGRGYHLYWLLKEACTPGEARAVVRELIRVMGGDESTHDPTRILRLPNTQNVKDPLKPLPCRLIRLDKDRKYNLPDFDALQDAASGERPARAVASKKTETPTAPRGPISATNGDSLVHKMARALAPFWLKSYRHNLAMALAALLRKSEVPQARALDVITAVAHAAKDTEIKDRQRAVLDTYAAEESRTAGSTLVQQVLGRDRGREFFKAFNQIMSSVPPPPIERPGFPDLDLYQCIPQGGFFDSYLHHAAKFTDTPAQFHIASMITLAAAALGNNVWVPYYGKQRLYANLYSLMIGPPGRVRKSTAINMARKMGASAKVEEYPADATVEQLYARFSPDPIEMAEVESGNGKTREVPVAWEGRPAGIIYHSEFSRYLNASNKSYMLDSRAFFTDLYDGGRLVRETKSRGKYNIEDPAVSLLCGVTPAALKRSLAQSDIGDGFLSRFLIFVRPPDHEANYDLQAFETEGDVDLYSNLLGYLERLAGKSGEVRIVPHSQADQIRKEFEQWVDRAGDDYEQKGLYLMDSLICRLKSMATKIALVYSCDTGPGPLSITGAAMKQATNLCRYIAGTLEPFFEMIQPDDGNREVRFRNQVLDAIRRWNEKRPGIPIPHRNLLGNSRLDAEQLRRAADSLYQEGRIQIQQVYNGRGKLYFLNEKEL